jgi:hypothetical protein
MQAVVDRRVAAGKGLAGDDVAIVEAAHRLEGRAQRGVEETPCGTPCSSSQTLEDVDRCAASSGAR